ncbi:MAG TPA: hypothetical protein VK604_27225 [Bryobacteraceae bacterium]|nr:hypothetical protein [Bryobacteraceae bacterium]
MQAQRVAQKAIQAFPASVVPSANARRAEVGVIQAMFWEKKPDGQYVFHYGSTKTGWAVGEKWIKSNDPDYKRPNEWYAYGVWERASNLPRQVLSQVSNVASSVVSGIATAEASVPGTTTEDKLRYVGKMVALMLGVGAIVVIGSTFITIELPAWVSIASRGGSIGIMVSRLAKWAYDVHSARREDSSTFDAHARNGVFVTLSFVQTAVELSMSGGKYVFLTGGWHYELYQFFKWIASCSCCKSSQTESTPLLAEV